MQRLKQDAFTNLSGRLYIDILRGFAIFLMLWGHCIQYCSLGSFDFFENTVFKIIYSFHMPLLMLISGYLFFRSAQKRSLTELLTHRAQAMLQPIIMCGILYFLLTEGLRGVVFERNVMKLVGGGWLEYLNVYWFLWSVLAASIAVGIPAKKSKRLVFQVLLVLAGVLFVAMFPNAQHNIFVYPYFVLGFYYAQFEDYQWMKKLCRLKYVSFLAFPLMMLFFTKDHYIYTSGLIGSNGILHQMPTNIFRWIVGLMGCIFTLTIFEIITCRIKQSKKLPFVINALRKLGEKSLQVYILSSIFLSEYLPVAYRWFVGLVGSNIFAKNMWVYSCLFTPLLAITYSGVLLLLVSLLEKKNISKVLFGK